MGEIVYGVAALRAMKDLDSQLATLSAKSSSASDGKIVPRRTRGGGKDAVSDAPPGVIHVAISSLQLDKSLRTASAIRSVVVEIDTLDVTKTPPETAEEAVRDGVARF